MAGQFCICDSEFVSFVQHSVLWSKDVVHGVKCRRGRGTSGNVACETEIGQRSFVQLAAVIDVDWSPAEAPLTEIDQCTENGKVQTSPLSWGTAVVCRNSPETMTVELQEREILGKVYTLTSHTNNDMSL